MSRRATTITLYAVAAVCIVAAWPADGLLGVALAVVGIACLWTAWARVVRKGQSR